jgi:hypothetical protein
MFKESTLAVVAPLAQSLTESGRRLTVKLEEYPLAIVANGYSNPVQPNQTAYSHELAVSTEALIDQANTQIAENTVEEFEHLAELMAKGMKTIVFNCRNVIVPAVEALVKKFEAVKDKGMAPQLEISVFNYHAVHSDPRLVNHVADRYTGVQAKPAYQSFLIAQPSVEQIIEMVANQNPHLDAEQVTEWLLTVGADKIKQVWHQLFGISRSLTVDRLEFMASHKLPFTVDEVALAYLLTGHLIENPLDVQGESVDIDSWSHVMTILHQLFGAQLFKAYDRRAYMVKRGQVVLHTEAKDPVKTRTVLITVNGDTYPEWLERGGEVEALLGAAVYAPNVVTRDQLDDQAEVLASRWRKLYPLIRQACLDVATRNTRRYVQELMLTPDRDLMELLPEIGADELREHVMAAMAQVTEEKLMSPFTLFAELICRVYFPNPVYFEFLQAMNHYARIHPDATGRELAAPSLIQIAADWLAGQIKVEDFTPIVDDVPVGPVTQPDEAEATEADAVEEPSEVESAVEGAGAAANTDVEGTTDDDNVQA